MSCILSGSLFIPGPCFILSAARHVTAFIYSYSIEGLASCAAMIIAPCNHINILLVCKLYSGLTYYIIILSILFFLISLDIYSRIFIILLTVSFDAAVMQPCSLSLPFYPIAYPVE